MFISLDGVTESPDQWQFDVFDDDMMTEMNRQLEAQDAVLLGRVTYEEWASYWPASTDEPFASYINNIPKYVVSTTLNKVEWQNSTLWKGNLVEEINKLRQQSGKNIGVAGSPTLVRSLIELDLLDELSLSVHPVIAGKGKRLFTEGVDIKRLKLVSNTTSGTGVAFLTYQRHS
jgi:dihydrofolate reductase